MSWHHLDKATKQNKISCDPSISGMFCFLLEAIFGPRVMSLPVSVCPCVRMCVYQSRACPHDNSSLVEAKITKFRTRRAKSLSISTRGKFWPPGIVSACICPSVHHQFVYAITYNLFKLGTLNLDHRCKRPWLRSLLFLGVIDLDSLTRKY